MEKPVTHEPLNANRMTGCRVRLLFFKGVLPEIFPGGGASVVEHAASEL